MDKKNAKRTAAIAAAAAVGSASGNIGAEAVINSNHEESEVNGSSSSENPENISISVHIYDSSHAEDINTTENQEQQIVEVEPNIINGPVIDPVNPVTPEEPIVILPIAPAEPYIDVQCMYAGPDNPIFNIGADINMEPDMYGGPIDDIYNPEDNGILTIDEDEIMATGNDTIVEDPAGDYTPTDMELV